MRAGYARVRPTPVTRVVARIEKQMLLEATAASSVNRTVEIRGFFGPVAGPKKVGAS